jgi:uncharacterized membrane protein YcjF (UPF0283 family)
MSSTWQLIVAIVPGLLIAVATSVITVQLTLRQFYSQKWWERKAEAYSKIIEALYYMQMHRERVYNAEVEGVRYSKDRMDEWAKHASAGYAEIDKATAIGAYVISEEAANILTTLRKEQDRIDAAYEEGIDYIEIIDSHWSAIGKCLTEIRACARRDLKVE